MELYGKDARWKTERERGGNMKGMDERGKRGEVKECRSESKGSSVMEGRKEGRREIKSRRIQETEKMDRERKWNRREREGETTNSKRGMKRKIIEREE